MAGVGVVRFEHGRGEPYLARARRAGPGNLDQLLAVISEGMDQVNDLSDAELDGAKRHSIAPFLGEVMLGHLQLRHPRRTLRRPLPSALPTRRPPLSKFDVGRQLQHDQCVGLV